MADAVRETIRLVLFALYLAFRAVAVPLAVTGGLVLAAYYGTVALRWIGGGF